MKQVIAVVRPYLAEQVLDAIRSIPVEALIVREVKGYGRQKNYVNEYSDSEYGPAFLPKVEITLWTDESHWEEAAKKIMEAARSGRMGDGKIMVLPVLGMQVAS